MSLIRTLVPLSPQLRKRVEEYCADHTQTIAAVVRLALDEFLDKREAKTSNLTKKI